MSKVHLQSNKGLKRGPMALCASRLNSEGKRINNNRRTYVGMASVIVPLEQFKATSAADRCAHCCDILLPTRNRQRALLGKPPVMTYDEGWA